MRDEDRDIRLHKSRIYREMLNNQIKLNHQFRRQMDQLSLPHHRPRLLTQSSVLTELLRKKEQRQSFFLPSIFDRNMPIQSESRLLELPVFNSPPLERLSPVKELVTDFEEEDDYGASCEQIIFDLQQINERSWKDLRKISEQSRNRMRTEQNYPRIESRMGNYGGRMMSPASHTLENTRVNYQSLGNPERVMIESKGTETDPSRMEFKAQESNYSFSNQGSNLRNQISSQSSRKIDSRLSATSKVSSQQNQKPTSRSPSPLIRLKKEKFIQQLRRANSRGQSLEVKLRFLRSKRARGK